jgi:V8-like Glu-specific endopeptidase
MKGCLTITKGENMSAKKTGRRNSTKRNGSSKLPSGPEEYLSLSNTPAEKSLPKELAAQAETQRVTIYAPGLSGLSKGIDSGSFKKSSEAAGAWEIELPAGTGIGLPGRKGGRMSPAEVARGIKSKSGAGRAATSGEPFRPAWVDYTPHPKISTESQPLLQKLDGRLVEPHYGVFGADNRQVYYPSGYPWTCVGKVFVWNNFANPNPSWSASAVLIGNRVILTAGHVAPWGSNNWAMRFIPAYYDGASTLGAGVSSWVSDYWGYNTGNSVSAWDMLVCRLYTPLGSTYGYFGTKNYDSSWQGGNYWTLAGYPGAVAGGNRPSRQMWWPVLDDDSSGSAEEVEYEADATAGNSGGPAFGFWDGQPYAIATHSGGSKTTFLGITIEDTNVGAGGGALNSLVSWARTNWP